MSSKWYVLENPTALQDLKQLNWLKLETMVGFEQINPEKWADYKWEGIFGLSSFNTQTIARYMNQSII